MALINTQVTLKSFRHALFLFSVFIIVNQISCSIENCSLEKDGKCLQCSERYVLETGECVQCEDKNCLRCFTSRPNNCFECPQNFVLSNRKCGKKCDNLDQCDICSDDFTQCYHCKHGCEIENGECSCKSRVIVIIVCVVLSVVIIIIVFICLTKANYVRKYKVVRLALNLPDENIKNMKGLNEENIEQNLEIQDIGNNHEKDTDNLEYKKAFPKQPQTMNNFDIRESKEVLTSSGNDQIICDYCLIEIGVIRLGCGCYLCKGHKGLYKDNSCPVCKKKTNEINVAKCEICLRIVGDEETSMKTSKCGCHLGVCQACLLKINEGIIKCPYCQNK